jgi:predicted nucleotidyltransferase
MKIVGIVSEYNPFHNGHMYQIKKAKELSGAGFCIAVMSGSFVQRGEPAICDKWARAEMALRCGVDLVVELPVIYSAQSAEFFATGAVRILDKMGADFISFGAENDDIEALSAAARLFAREPEEFKKHLGLNLKKGISFPKARENAAHVLGIKDIISSPNNILGIEYIKALQRLGSKMKPVPVKRVGSQHDGVGSASYLRSIMPISAKEYMPRPAFKIYQRELKNKKAPVTIAPLEIAIVSRLRIMPASELSLISGVSEGLENRIKQAVSGFSSLDDIICRIKTKRYVLSRIRRIMINALLNITHEDVIKKPEYIRILGMNANGQRILKNLKSTADIPIIVKTADAIKTDMLLKDFAATDIYSLLYPDKAKRCANLDLTTSPVII